MNIQSEYPFPRTADSTRRTLVLRVGAAVGLSVVMLLASFFPRVAQAATIVVDRFDDDPTATACTLSPNDCSLRGAIITANNFSTNPGSDTITLQSGTYLLDEVGTGESNALNGDLDIRGPLIINGADETTTIIDGNGSVTLENVFTIDGSNAAEMNDLTITNGGGTGSSVGAIVASGGLTLTNVTIDNNHGTGSAGGIYSSTALSLTNSTISNNTGGIGGIYVHNGTLTITSSEINGNIATSTGGGINFNNGTATIDGNTLIHDNQSTGGGGIFAWDGTMTITNSQIYMNDAEYSGGGIYLNTTASVTLNGSTVNSNDATGSGSVGGGIENYGALIMNGGQVALNTAGNSGGGIHVNTSATANLSNVAVNDNYTTEDPSYGGGIYNYGGQVTLEGSNVQANYVSGTASSFSYGGGIYSTSGDLTLTDTTIIDNDSLDSGGGVFFSDGNLTITNAVFRGNQTTGTFGAGGGLFNGSGSTAIIKQIEFSANSAASSSGGLHNQGALTLENATISGNSSLIGAGMLTTGSDPTSILNSTIYTNTITSGLSAGGLVAYNTVTVKNTIVAGNDNDECLNYSGTSISSSGNNLSGDSTCGFTAGGDQANTNPQLDALADNGGFSKTHALLPGSPAIDAGTNSGCPATDQRGWTRPIDGDTNGTAICDIGAYEKTIDLFLPLIMR